MTNFVRNTHTVKNFEEGTSETYTIMCIVDFREAKEGTLAFPHCRHGFFDPMTSNGKITVGVAGLPCVTGDIYGATNSITLQRS